MRYEQKSYHIHCPTSESNVSHHKRELIGTEGKLQSSSNRVRMLLLYLNIVENEMLARGETQKKEKHSIKNIFHNTVCT